MQGSVLHIDWAFRASQESAHRDVGWVTLLEGAAPAPLTQVVGGHAEGLFGGNLSVLAALVGTPYFPDLTDTVLALEDVGERPYRLDRMLTTLLQSGLPRAYAQCSSASSASASPAPTAPAPTTCSPSSLAA